ncbi:MAG: hypothetical protein AAFR90_02710 [Pseudomonadota bacterium]
MTAAAVGTSAQDPNFALIIPKATGRGVESGDIHHFMDALDKGLYEIQKAKLEELLKKLNSDFEKEKAWRLAAAATYRLLEENYKGRRFQIIGISDGVTSKGQEAIVFKLAVTAAVFDVLKDALETVELMRSSDKIFNKLKTLAETASMNAVPTLRDKFMNMPELFHVEAKVEHNSIALTARIDEQQSQVCTLGQFVDNLNSMQNASSGWSNALWSLLS